MPKLSGKIVGDTAFVRLLFLNVWHLSDYLFSKLEFVRQLKIGGRANVSILESDMYKNLVKGGNLSLK